MWIAECATPGCNMLDAAHVQRLAEIHAAIKAVVVDGDPIVTDYDKKYEEAQPERPWAKWAGSWSFETATNNEKCFMAGQSCMFSSVLQAFDLDTVATLDDAATLAAFNTWAGANTASAPGLVGDAAKDANGDYTSASALMGSYTITMDEVFITKMGGELDEIADAWEAGALCELGVDVADDDEWTGCEKDDLISFKPQFMRSWGDEFGAAIKNDVSKLGIAYMLILVYMIIMLSGWDAVNSMVGMSMVVIIIVGLSFGGCMGIGAHLGLYNNNLNNNIPFLLLGLGVDDAFVLSSEFRRACTMMPGTTIEQRIGAAMRTGGMSILITSTTDALAFLIGASTVLPALSWFCSFAGIGVLLCFLLQIFLFMPCLAINAKRAEANRIDCCCCCKAGPPVDVAERFDTPQGWCHCCTCSWCITPNKLPKFMEEKFGAFVTSTVGIAITFGVFGIVTLLGVIGAANIYQDFRLEWFIPADSYVQDYIAANEEYSSVGTRFSVYTPDVSYFDKQAELQALSSYLTSTPLIDHTQGVTDWHASFMTYAAATYSASLTNGLYTVKATYYAHLWDFVSSGAGSRFRSHIKWVSAACNSDDPTVRAGASCVPASGVTAARMSATLTLATTETGALRYDAMDTMRSQVTAAMDGAFPYSFEFLYWEEVGVIGWELTRNLLVCGGVIVAMVCLMIPKIQVSAWVVTTIIISIIDVVGLLYFWDVTISGVSTIYILICVGLAVDYSAHIAHMFKESTGTSQERAKKALGRIGPSVFNAVVSTFLAVVVIGFSTSYVFVVFFKAFFLVTVIAGAGGLWLLPCLLGLFGGDNLESEETVATPKQDPEKAEPEP
jgi:predicted RND superfamily exporter protein